MEHALFNFNIEIVGLDVHEFIKMLKDNGYDEQAEKCEEQFDNEIRANSEGKSSNEQSNCNITCVSGSFNTWTNKLGDRITFMGCRSSTGVYTISIGGVYIKSVGGLNVAKSFVNKSRGKKLKWVGSFE